MLQKNETLNFLVGGIKLWRANSGEVERESDVTCHKTQFWLMCGTFEKLWTGESISRLPEETFSCNYTPGEKLRISVRPWQVIQTITVFRVTNVCVLTNPHSCLPCSSSGGRRECTAVTHVHVFSSHHQIHGRHKVVVRVADKCEIWSHDLGGWGKSQVFSSSHAECFTMDTVRYQLRLFFKVANFFFNFDWELPDSSWRVPWSRLWCSCRSGIYNLFKLLCGYFSPTITIISSIAAQFLMMLFKCNICIIKSTADFPNTNQPSTMSWAPESHFTLDSIFWKPFMQIDGIELKSTIMKYHTQPPTAGNAVCNNADTKNNGSDSWG